MEDIPPELHPQSDSDRFLGFPHKDRWEQLKPVIVRLYCGNYGGNGKATKIKQIADFMRTHYSFHAAVNEYPPRFRLWEVNDRRSVKNDKDDVIYALSKRKRPGTSTSQVSIHDRPFPPQKLRRYLKEQTRRHNAVQTVMPGILFSWNLPYEAFVSSLRKNPDKPSPFGPNGTTPEYMKIRSPKPLTPGREADGPSPNLELVYQKARMDRASLFLQGQLEELIVSMCKEDRRLCVNYFHDFYIHGFTMAKNWSLDRLKAQNPPTPNINPQTHTSAASPAAPPLFPYSSSPSAIGYKENEDISRAPTQLCRWVIHVSDATEDYKIIDENEDQSLVQSSSMETNKVVDFTDELLQSMTSNSFTSTPLENLAIATDEVIRAIQEDPVALEVDAWKLAIMAGNSSLLSERYRNRERAPEGLDDIHPFHLAAAFLNGGHTCCMMFEMLVRILSPTYAFHHNVDSFGHTILDALLVSIIRSHTSLSPETVSFSFQSPNRFPGEEKDICGRWDPTTDKVRHLFQQGYSRIPTKWKHAFCHTAAQAICHSIIVIFGPACAPNINTMSGLFIRRCTICGMELRLGPLHTLVIITFYLAQQGMPGETLFGALAVLVCLLSLGADVSLEANISVEEILGNAESRECRHKPFSPFQLMQEVPDDLIDGWSSECRTGWSSFAQVLAHVEASMNPPLSENSDRGLRAQFGEYGDDNSEISLDYDPEMGPCGLENWPSGVHTNWLKLKCQSAEMGLLWATIQTELLTYRRIGVGDAWLSDNFSMEALEAWLKGNSAEFLTPLVQDQMLQEHSRCGWFHRVGRLVCPTAPEVSASHFMNMDSGGRGTYERATFLDVPDLIFLWADVTVLEEP
ncbi:hypothetical protein GQX73_g6010 [Xylaria multiplex]|uniref:Clr5 domain-containing protein n=1 Tax=Xylaria multiplex TaxID=323545 RepID=A0A7C8MTG7_9PEZI|nr:hypothetical protein GQX73_g6010 [Xylaria multiplex]